MNDTKKVWTVDISGYVGRLEFPISMSNSEVYDEVLNAEACLDRAEPFRDDRLDMDALLKELGLE